MKVRISGQTIRFRLSRIDVNELKEKLKITQWTQFGPKDENSLSYTLEVSPVDSLVLNFNQNQLLLSIPESLAQEWLETELVGFDSTLHYDNSTQLYILVEKDFQCLIPRPHENEENNFTNPLAKN